MTELDPGLQPERTQLAWNRTAFSAAIVGCLCLRGWIYQQNAGYGAAFLLVLIATAAVVAQRKCAVAIPLVLTGVCLAVHFLRLM